MNVAKLKAIYPSLILLEQDEMERFDQYEWFETDTKETLGIKKAELSEKEYTLLKTLLTTVDVLPPLNDREKMWSRILFENKEVKEKLEGFRFVFFFTNQEVKEPELFNEAIKAASPSPILWMNRREGILIEEIRSKRQNPARFHEIVDLIMSDLYMNVSFFIGERHHDLSNAHALFQWYQSFVKNCRKKSSKKIMYVKDLVPSYLASLIDARTSDYLPTVLLKEAAEDRELIKTVRLFLESNLNATETAKKMYLHRNSLQYRIDKFIEMTGIDIKTFQGAVTTYLALQMLEEM
ncbi:PucR family transcriptional regulator [Salirhabdus sp. Marseille-P4669]|uniref:PucR family transcriptional regulator n=1 Tax=Salirhabdus sp. Marseille-P4669 TaxID=2042310 RepID=UPI000C7D460C|nr:helix-turn-helix domain-containing protein [Salirhabdus sp. Marseille-P4669]